VRPDVSITRPCLSGLITSVSVNGAMWECVERKVPDHVPWTAASCDAAGAVIRLWSPVPLVRGSGPAPTVEAGSISRRASVNFSLVIVFLDLPQEIIL
jgi:hypothetical protein